MSRWTRASLLAIAVMACALWSAGPVWAQASAAPRNPATPPPSAVPTPKTAEEAIKGTATYQFGQSRVALTALGEFARQASTDPAQRSALAKQIAAAIPSAVSPEGKQFFCRQLALIGGAEVVPALAGMLTADDAADMARFALERMPDPAAGAALRDALPKAKGKVLIGIVNSVGERRERQSVAALTGLLSDGDTGVAAAAAAALGKIGGADAAKALSAARGKAPAAVVAVIVDAYLSCADTLLAEKKDAEAAAIYQEIYTGVEKGPIKLAALRGLIVASGDKAAGVAIEALKSPDAQVKAMAVRAIQDDTKGALAAALAGQLAQLPTAAQALVLEALAARSEAPGVLPAIVAATKSADAAVRVAAIRALGQHGDASSLGVLSGSLASGAAAEQDAARDGLRRLKGAEVNAAILAAAKQGDAKVRAEMIKALAVRGATAAVPDLFKLAGDAEQTVRGEAFTALGALAGDAEAADLVKALVGAQTDADRAAAEAAILAMIPRLKDRQSLATPALAEMAKAAPAAKASLLKVLSRTGGAEALAAVKAAVKDADKTVADAAFRALTEWPEVAAAGDLLSIAQTSADQKQQVLALRGYVRLAGVETNGAAKLSMLEKAMSAAKRPEEKRVVLAGLGDSKQAKALKQIEPLLDDTALANEASLAVVNLAKAAGKSDKPAFSAALNKVIRGAKDNNVKKQAQDALKGIGAAEVQQ